MTPSLDIAPHRPAIDPGQVDDLRRRLFGDAHADLQVPGYRIEAELGQGSFGRVFRAFDRRFQRQVALKIIRVDSPQNLLRVEREAQALARLSHPNVVQVYDKGPAGQEHYFIALEYLEGQSLDQWLREEKRPLAAIIDTFLLIAKGLAAAHEAGLVHRDLKPANVVVGDDGRVRLLDFGLARAADTPDRKSSTRTTADDHPILGSSGPAESSASLVVPASAQGGPSTDPEGNLSCAPPEGHLAMPLTVEGHFVGTPYYAAPEQHRGHADARSDQFSFCVALFEALYGRRPYSFDRTRDIAPQLEQQRLDLRRGSRRVPRWLVALLRRGLAFDPTKRHASMAVVAQRIEHRLRVHPSRMRLLAIAGGTTLATALAVGLAIETEPERIAQCREARAELPERWASDLETIGERSPGIAGDLEAFTDGWQAQRARVCHEPQAVRRAAIDACLDASRGAYEQLSGWLVEADEVVWESVLGHRGPRPLAPLIDTLPEPSECVLRPEEAATEERIAAWELLLEARTLMAAGELDEAGAKADEAVDAGRTIGDRRVDVAGEYLGLVIDDQREKPKRKVSLLTLVISAKNAGQPKLAADVVAFTVSGLAMGRMGLQRGYRDLELLQLANELARLAAAEDDPEIAAWLAIAEGYARNWRSDTRSALECNRRASRLLKQAGARPLWIALADLQVAIMSSGMKEIPNREQMMLDALQKRRDTQPPASPPLAIDLFRTADSLVRIGNKGLAEQHYREADAIFEQHGRDFDRARVHNEIAIMHQTIAARAYKRAKAAERDGGDPSVDNEIFEDEKNTALTAAILADQFLDPFRPPLDDLSVEPIRAETQARIETGLMRTYGLVSGCGAQMEAAVHRSNRVCLALHGDDVSCVAARKIWLQMLHSGIPKPRSDKRCEPRPLPNTKKD